MSHNHADMGSTRWRKLRRKAFDRDGWRCRLCGGFGPFEADHIVALRYGGAMWNLDNIQCLCRPCHREKTAAENRGRPRTAGERAWRTLVAEFRGEAG